MIKKTLLTSCLFLFFFISNMKSSFAQTGQVWVTISNSNNVPYSISDGSFRSNDSTFNEYLRILNIFSVQKALPASRKKELQQVYELTCNCPQTELESKLSNFVSAVSGVFPAPKYDTLHTPNDYNLVPGINDYALNLINAQTAWDITTGDSNVVIGITDQNYNPLHSELVGKFVHLSPSNATTTHGTAVSILAAGKTNNNNGLSSIGYNCKLGLYLMSFNEVLIAAYAGVKVINMSWAAGCFYNSYQDLCMQEAYETGAFLIAAAGNGNTCGAAYEFVYPASYNCVFSVTSIGSSDNHILYPNDTINTHQHNPMVDLAAPGYNVAVNPAEGWFIQSSGTSYAAPYVAGTVGLMLSVNPCLSRKDIDTILKLSSTNIDLLNPLFVGRLGAGRLNAQAAVSMALGWATNPMSVTIQPTSNVTVVAGNSIQLTTSSTSSFPTYQWQYDSSGIFVDLSNNITYSGVNTSTLSISNINVNFNGLQYRCVMTSGYCQAITNNSTLTIVTGVVPGNAGPITGSTNICAGEISIFQINPVTNASGYLWTVTGSNTTIISGQNSTSITVQSFDNNFQVSVTPTNAYGNGTSSQLNVNVIALPQGSINTNTIICSGGSALLQIQVIGTGPWSGLLNNNIPFSGNTSPISVFVSPTSTTSYYLTELTTNGCSALPDDLISNSTVTVTPTVITTVPLQLCNSQFPYLLNGTYITTPGNYYDTITNSSGCDSIVMTQVSINQGNPPNAPASITQTLVSNVCNNRIYRYTASITNTATSYQWLIPTTCGGLPSVIVDSGDINSSRIIRLKFTSNQAAFSTDSIKVRAGNQCGYGPYRAAKLINTALNTPLAPSAITVTPISINVCNGRRYRYTAPNLPNATANNAGATGYLWSFSSPLPLFAQLDSGTLTSQIIVVKYISNLAANPGDSIYLQYASNCGLSNKKSLKISLTALNPPAAPASIAITPVSVSICNERKYRFTMPVLPSATTTSGAASGYEWLLTGNLATYGVVDSGSLNSRIVVIKFTSNNATQIGDSIKARYLSDCGNGPIRALKFSVPNLLPPLAPISITITPLITNQCGNRIYRYSMPILPVGTASRSTATGYQWEFTGTLGANAVIDSGTINSRIIRMKFTSNTAASIGDSVRANYLSSCGPGPKKSAKLTNTVILPPLMPSSITMTNVSLSCGSNVYRYSAPALPSATSTYTAATGYQWQMPIGPLGSTGVLDSGSIQSQTIRIKYTSNAIASVGDSIKVFYNSACGNSNIKTQKLNNVSPSILPAPTTLTGSINVCSILGTTQSYRYTTAAVNGAVSYVWTIPAGAVIDSGSNGLIIRVRFVTAGSNDSILVQAMGSNTCVGAKKGLRLNTTGCVTPVSSKDEPSTIPVAQKLDIEIYPNPSLHSFFIHFKDQAQSNPLILRVYDMQGRLMINKNVNRSQTYSFGERLLPGAYQVQIIDKDKVIKKVIIKQ